MAAPKDQKFVKTPFKKQADVIAGILRTNPVLNDDEKASLNETVGILTWLNQLQIHWAGSKDSTNTIPKEIAQRIFEDRTPQKLMAQAV